MDNSNILIKNLKKNQYYNQTNFLFKQNFIGKLIKKGNKFYALNYFNRLKYFLKRKLKKDPNILLFLIIFYSTIKFHFIKKRFGGSKKEIPIYLNKNRQVKFIIKKMFNYSKSLEKRKSLDLNKLINLYLLTLKKKGFLIVNKYKAFIKAKENKILVKSLKK
jgi:Ribosomal protein S7p/S5e